MSNLDQMFENNENQATTDQTAVDSDAKVAAKPVFEENSQKQAVSESSDQVTSQQQTASEFSSKEDVEKQSSTQTVEERSEELTAPEESQLEDKLSIRVFHARSLGESHKVSQKPCQDAALSFEEAEQNIYIGLVSDGHGSSTYFRSDRGSQFLVEVAKNILLDFVRNFQFETSGQKLVQIPVRENVEKQDRKLDSTFRNLFSSIISAWNDKIYQDWQADKPSEEDLKGLKIPDSVLANFKQNQDIELAYGCTLIGFVRTATYWFSFQLGDGTCIIFDQTGKWSRPIPADEKCVGNITTSMCELDALNNFRYCCGLDNFPVAVFIASDGLDGVYGRMETPKVIESLALLYNNFIRYFSDQGYETTRKEIAKALPLLSEKGVTRDDMALAGWIELDKIKSILDELLQQRKAFHEV